MIGYETAAQVFGIAFMAVGCVTLFFYTRVMLKVRRDQFADFRRAMQWMQYDAAERYVDLSGHKDLARMRLASKVLMGIMLCGAALIFIPVLLGEGRRPG